jgi:hypothetical protein
VHQIEGILKGPARRAGPPNESIQFKCLAVAVAAVLATLLPALLAAVLATLAGLLGLLAGSLATALLLTGLLLAALLAWIRVLRILVHRLLPWDQPRTTTPRARERSVRGTVHDIATSEHNFQADARHARDTHTRL